MITLQSDELRFSFPEIRETLLSLVEAHIQRVLPGIIESDRGPLLEALKGDYRFGAASRTAQQKALAKIANLTPSAIETALRTECEKVSRLGVAGQFAAVTVSFQRTLRIPDDGKVYPLPAGLGQFPLRMVDDYPDSVPEPWLKRGGVLMPLYQSEALWISFDASYPIALKIASGKINAATGEAWAPGLQREPQNYVVLPDQPWLDGFCVGEGMIRQFVAMPLGDGYSVEEQVTGKADVGGLQFEAFPLKAEAYFRDELEEQLPSTIEDLLEQLVGHDLQEYGNDVNFCLSCPQSDAMGLGAGGLMRQEIYRDPRDFADWNTGLSSRCFVHLCNSLVWRQITGTNPPHPPLTAREYLLAGFPWFDHYRDDLTALPGSKILAAVKSVLQFGVGKVKSPLPGDSSIDPKLIIQRGNARRPDEVRGWSET